MVFGACLSGFVSLSAQNITDIAVMGDSSADKEVQVQAGFSSVDSTVFLHPDRIRYDNRCFQIEGRDVFLFSGTFHYFRVPQPLWADRFRKLKEAGFNCVETYVPWNWHEREMPRSPEDESCLDMQPLEDFLTMAEAFGLYVIVRPGPYICAEWSGGGFPQWIMRKKPKETTHDVWLQSNDPEFVRWNEHWYRAVCRVVKPHQITRKARGEAGVILFQIENEFNRIKWFPTAEKKAYLESLARMVRGNGIEVPLITCWTNEARNVEDGPLNGVLDMVNSYPRWQVERGFGRLINQQLKTQPGKPLLSGELQGGWYSDVGGKLSREQDGQMPVQTQNVTLYALQRGFCGINYYMAVGGTNFDDWGARQMTTSYDYAAAIQENGATNDRYLRFRGLSVFLKEHGTRIARAGLTDLDYTCTDPDVEVALRTAEDGSRYYFVRTEEHTKHHFGTFMAEGLTLDFSLEPFGSMVYYLPAGAESGKWFPEIPMPEARPSVKADTVRLENAAHFADALPLRWKKLKAGEYMDDKGIYGRHLVYYRTFAPQGGLLEVGRIGNKEINGTDADGVSVMAGGRLLSPAGESLQSVAYRLPGDSAAKGKQEVIVLFESKGLHHHTNKEVEDNWKIGIDYIKCNGKALPLEYACTERERGTRLSQGEMPEAEASGGDGLMKWFVASFTLPARPEGVRYPYHLRLEHTGNGFVYVNGKCAGRCWEKGPQKDYYVPECWLKRDGENYIAVSLRPVKGEAAVKSAFIVPEIWDAEKENE